MKYEWLSIEPDKRGGVIVYGHGTYEETSVLAGYPLRQWIKHFDTVEEAQKAYPTAEVKEWPTKMDVELPRVAPSWFDPGAAGEVWDEEDY